MEILNNPRFWNFEDNLAGSMAWFIPLIFAAVFRFRRSPVQVRVLYFAAFSLLMEYVSVHPGSRYLFTERTNSGWYHIGTPILLFLLLWVFKPFLTKLTSWEKVCLAWLSFALLAVVNALWFDGFSGFPTITVGIYSFLGIVITCGYFGYLLRTLEVVRLEREPLFWISCGMLLYYSGNFLLWSVLTFLTYNRAFFNSIYEINGWLTLLLNIILAIALCLRSTAAVAAEGGNEIPAS